MSVGVGFSGAGRRTGRRAAARPGAALVLALLCVLAGGALGQDAGETGDRAGTDALTRQLFDAIEDGDEGRVRDLIAAGVDVNDRLSNIYTPLFFATMYSRAGVVNALVELGSDLEDRTPGGGGATPFLMAVEEGNEYMVRHLIAAGANIKAVDHRGRTALHLIVPKRKRFPQIDRRKRIMRRLIAAGLDIEARDADGKGPLHTAAESEFGGEGFVYILLKSGADAGAQVQGTEMKGATALHLASARGNLFTVNLLLSPWLRFGVDTTQIPPRSFFVPWSRLNLDVNATTDSGRTALSLAAENGHARVVRRLLAVGADAGRAYVNGSTAVALAIDNEHEDVAEILRRHERGGFVPRCMIAARGLLGI